jgi:hypothetical protein
MKNHLCAFRAHFLRVAPAFAVVALFSCLSPVRSPAADLTADSTRIRIDATTTPGDATSLFRITAPGHYYLAQNITGVAGKSGIAIAANDVTLDLNGFTLIGGSGVLYGIDVSTGGVGNRLKVRNGTIRGWMYGVYEQRTGAHYSQLHLIDSQQNGLMTGIGSTITDCTVSGSGEDGFVAGGEVTLIRSRARFCRVGFKSGSSSRVSDCVATANREYGFVLLGFNHVVQGCIASDSGLLDGFDIGETSVVTACTSFNNRRHGFKLGRDSTISMSTTQNNRQHGFLLGIGGSASGCTAGENTLDGFNVVETGRIEKCTAVSNGQNGFSLGGVSMITGSLARFNGLHGIAVMGGCQVVGNHSVINGRSSTTGAGIYATNEGSHIEGNTCNVNDIGFSIVGRNNIVVRNTARSNGLNFNFAAGVEYGQVINNPGAGFNSPNSWANIGY